MKLVGVKMTPVGGEVKREVIREIPSSELNSLTEAVERRIRRNALERRLSEANAGKEIYGR